MVRIMSLLMPDDIKGLLEKSSKEWHTTQSTIIRIAVKKFCEAGFQNGFGKNRDKEK